MPSNTTKIRTRFGFKISNTFPNMGIFVRYFDNSTFDKLNGLFVQIKEILTLTGNSDLADKFVFTQS